MSERTGFLLFAGGLLIIDGFVAWLTWGTALLYLCFFLTVGVIAATVGAFVDGDGREGGDINGGGGVGLGI
ncbi:hypothetical protein ACWGIT_20385 [Streptomyces cyaneofuscatus]